MLRMIVQPPIHFLGLERLMEPFQQAQLLWRAALDPRDAGGVVRVAGNVGCSMLDAGCAEAR
jgi:hypothetical protein